ncbi:hypothetical protein GCM10010340_15020 [Streptomyces griseoloalbus]|nr:hypothetical protein GCM10010340_15020 [Streptomyces albaduncus]
MRTPCTPGQTAGPARVTRAGHDPAAALPELDRLIDARCADYRDAGHAGFPSRARPGTRHASCSPRSNWPRVTLAPLPFG